MIIVRVELHSAITGHITEIARMHISNKGDSGDPQVGNYDVATLRGRTAEQLNKNHAQRTGAIEGHARLREHVWTLVAKALHAMAYSPAKDGEVE